MFKRWLLISTLAVLFMVVVVACAQSSDTLETSPSEAEALIIERCSDCHSADRVFNEDYSREDWSDVFDEMIAKGAEVSEAEKEAMIDWLVSRE